MPANAGTQRSTLVTIAGQTASITQAGRLCLASRSSRRQAIAAAESAPGNRNPWHL